MEKARVMIVEDEALAALSMKAYLEDQGYSVPAVLSTAEDAVEQTPRIEPDIVIMDIRLEGKADGIEAGDKIARGFRIPVIYLTAYSDSETLARASRTEPSGYLMKPLDERALCAAIETALYKSRIEAELRAVKRKQEIILNSVREGIIVAGIRGDIDYLNPAARRMFQFAEGEASSDRSVMSLFRLEDDCGSPVVLPLQRVLIDGKNASLSDMRLRRTDGNLVHIEVDMAPLRDERGSPKGIVIVVRDLVERKAAEAAC